MSVTLNITDNFTQLVTKFNQISAAVDSDVTSTLSTLVSNVGNLNDISAGLDNTSIVTAINSLKDLVDSAPQISVDDTGGDGSLTYNNLTGVITYTGPSASEVRAHFSAGDGIAITSGSIAIKSATRFRLFDSTGATILDLYGAGSL